MADKLTDPSPVPLVPGYWTSQLPEPNSVWIHHGLDGNNPSLFQVTGLVGHALNVIVDTGTPTGMEASIPLSDWVLLVEHDVVEPIDESFYWRGEE